MGIGNLCRFDHLLHSCIFHTEGNVVEEGVIEQNGLLVHVSYQRTQVVDAKILNIHTVNCNLTQLHIVIARQQIHQCRLAGTGLADKCNGLSFGHHQIDVLQHFALAVVTEGEVLKFNPVIHPVQRQRVYRFLNGILGFQYFVHTFHGCQTLWNVVSCLCKVFQRIDDTVQNHHIEDER